MAAGSAQPGTTHDICPVPADIPTRPPEVSSAWSRPSASMHIPSTHPRAQIGLLARKNNAATAPCVFVGFTGNGNLLLLCRSKDGAELEVVRTVLATMEEWSPCYLKLENNRGQFRAFVSRDNATWECIGTCQAAIPDYGKVGIAIASLTPDTMATADCKDIRLLIPPPSAPTGAGSPNPTP